MKRVAGKLIPWRRKSKIKKLDGDLDTAMSFAVVGSSEKFGKKFHAYKVYKLLKEMGSHPYPVAAGLADLEKDAVFPSLLSLPQKVDAVIPCLPAEFSLSIVREAKEAGINKVWFQNRTLSPEAFEFCQNNEMEITEGCVLKFKEFSNLARFVHPCYWHGKTILRKKKYL